MGARVWKRDASGEGGQVFTTGFAATAPEAHPRALKRKRVWRLEDQQQGPATPAANGQNGAPHSGEHTALNIVDQATAGTSRLLRGCSNETQADTSM